MPTLDPISKCTEAGKREGTKRKEQRTDRQADEAVNGMKSNQNMEWNGMESKHERNGLYSKHGMGFIQNMERGLFKTWNGVYSKHGTECIQNMERAVFKT